MAVSPRWGTSSLFKAKYTTTPAKLDLSIINGSHGIESNRPGAKIHSAPNRSARAPTMGPVMKLGADAATTNRI